MIQRIILEQFQAHKHTELELGPGVNVLTGLNNTGKSAVVEALRCLATNPPPRHVIRHGAAQARVEVVLEDGVRVAWNRKKNTAWYELWLPGQDEPEYFRKLGRGMVPDEVRDALRLDEVLLENGSQVDVHIGDQKKPIFLLDVDGADARLAEFFAASSEGAHLLAMQKALHARVREARIRERSVARRMEELQCGLDRLAALPEITHRGRLAREAGNAAQSVEQSLPGLEQALARRQELEQQAGHAQKRSRALRSLAALPELRETDRLRNALARLAETSRCRARAMGVSRALEPLQPVPQLQTTTDLNTCILELNHLKQKTKFIRSKAEALQNMQYVPEVYNVQPLGGLLQELTSLDSRLAAAREAAKGRARQLEDLRRQIQDRLEAVGTCPLCGGRLQADTFTGGGEVAGHVCEGSTERGPAAPKEGGHDR
ncbi:MAG: AAA family ATPase [Desulfovibrio sp.]